MTGAEFRSSLPSLSPFQDGFDLLCSPTTVSVAPECWVLLPIFWFGMQLKSYSAISDKLNECIFWQLTAAWRGHFTFIKKPEKCKLRC